MKQFLVFTVLNTSEGPISIYRIVYAHDFEEAYEKFTNVVELRYPGCKVTEAENLTIE